MLELQEQTRQEREAFQAARAAAEAEQAAIRKELEAERDGAAAAAGQARAERRRLVELRKRCGGAGSGTGTRRKPTWRGVKRIFRLGRVAWNRRPRSWTACEELWSPSSSGSTARRSWPGGRREQGQELALAHQQWETCLNQERAERDRRDRELDARTAALAEAEQTWAGRERSVRLSLAELYRESAGLEARIRSQREKLTEEEAAVARLRGGARGGNDMPAPVVLPAAAAEPAPVAGEARAAYLERVAGRLADQRAHLLEQWQALLRVQEEWRRGREQALAEMEAAGRALHDREQRLLRRSGGSTPRRPNAVNGNNLSLRCVIRWKGGRRG